MKRWTVIVEGPLAFRMRRWTAAAQAETGLQIFTLPMLAARLAGGFCRPVSGEDLEPAIASALGSGGYVDLGSMSELPGMTRAVVRTLTDLWSSDINLASVKHPNSRLRDLALVEQRVLGALPEAVLSPPALREAAMRRLEHAAATVGSVVLERVSEIAPVGR